MTTQHAIRKNDHQDRPLSLADIQPGNRCRVRRLHAEGAIQQRLMDMGLVRNSVLTVVRTAPLFDPIEIQVNDYFVTLRKTEASRIEVEHHD